MRPSKQNHLGKCLLGAYLSHSVSKQRSHCFEERLRETFSFRFFSFPFVSFPFLGLGFSPVFCLIE